METQTARKTISGKVLRRSGDKSIVVQVERMVKHPRVQKYVRRRKNFQVHDPANTCNPGDAVVIAASRPISRTKRWVFSAMIKRSVDAAGVAV